MKQPRYPLRTQCAERLPVNPLSGREYLRSAGFPLTRETQVKTKMDTSIPDVTVVVSDDTSFHESDPSCTLVVPQPDGGVAVDTHRQKHAASRRQVVGAQLCTAYEKALLECRDVLLPQHHITSQEAEEHKKADALERRRGIIRRYTRPLGTPKSRSISPTAVVAPLSRGRTVSPNQRSSTVVAEAKKKAVSEASMKQNAPQQTKVQKALLQRRNDGCVRTQASPLAQIDACPPPCDATATFYEEKVPAAPSSFVAGGADTCDKQQPLLGGCSSSTAVTPHHLSLLQHVANVTPSAQVVPSSCASTISMNSSSIAIVSQTNSRSVSPHILLERTNPFCGDSRDVLRAARFDAPRPLCHRDPNFSPFMLNEKNYAVAALASRTNQNIVDSDVRDAVVVRPLTDPRPCFSSDYILGEAAREGEIAALGALRAPRTSSGSSRQSASFKSMALFGATHLVPVSVLDEASNADTKRTCLHRWHRACQEKQADHHLLVVTKLQSLRTWYRATLASRLQRFSSDVRVVKILRQISAKRLVSQSMAKSFHRFCALRSLWQRWKKSQFAAATLRENGVSGESPSPSPQVLRTGQLKTFAAPQATTNDEVTAQSRGWVQAVGDEFSQSVEDMLRKHSADGVELFDGYPLILAARQYRAAVKSLLMRYWRKWLVAGRRASYRNDLCVIATRSHRSSVLLHVWHRWCQKSIRRRTRLMTIRIALPTALDEKLARSEVATVSPVPPPVCVMPPTLQDVHQTHLGEEAGGEQHKPTQPPTDEWKNLLFGKATRVGTSS